METWNEETRYAWAAAARRWSFALAAGTLLQCATTGQQASPTQPYQIDPQLRGLAVAAGCGASFTDPGGQVISLRARISPFNKELSLLWESRSPTGGAIGNLQIEPLAYTPTALSRGSTFGVVYVGGTSKFGVTKVTKYVYAAPQLDGNGGLMEAELQSSNVVYSAGVSAANRDVYHILPNRALPDRAFVQFWNTKNILDVNLTNGNSTLVASPTGSGNALVVPALLQVHNVVYSREHATHGYVYFFASMDPSSSLTSTTVLRDEDKDGDLDSSLQLTMETWQSQGFGNPALYVDE